MRHSAPGRADRELGGGSGRPFAGNHRSYIRLAPLDGNSPRRQGPVVREAGVLDLRL